MRTLGLLFLALAALPCAAGENVVLSSVNGSEFEEAARALAKHRDNAPIVPFDPADPEAVLPRLRELNPRSVAIVLRPEEIDVNSVRRILVMASKVDDDPFVDFEFAYVTGATAGDARTFVENIIRASKAQTPRRIGTAPVHGGKTPCLARDSEFVLGPLRFPERVVAFSAPDGAEGRDQTFIDANLRSLAGCGTIYMGGHGMPWEVSTGARAEDIARINLFPAVVFNYACHTGVAVRWLEETFDNGDFVARFAEIDPAKSFALSVIRSGATGYVAYVNPRPAGPELSIDFHRLLAGATLGETRRRDYDKIVLGYVGFGEKGIVPPVVKDGGRKPRKDLDVVRDMMLDAATGGIAYGDPAFRPYPATPAALPQSVRSSRDGADLRVTFRVSANFVFTWCSDPFAQAADGRGMLMKVCDRVELPQGFEPGDLTVEAASFGKDALETLPVVSAVESDAGKRFLHLKVNWAYRKGLSGDVEVRVRVKGKTKTR
ncbi:MAG: hypothetical protein HUU15_13515 [Candidatus Brocadiae bacterium]|nr:hypothetical protein [Candidatus Brocadiia bacterium]